jgi:predicted dehydrogenase
MTRIGILGTRHVHAEGLARGLEALGCTIVGAAERDTAAASDWENKALGEIMSRDAVIEASDAVIVAGTNIDRVDDTLAAVDAGLYVLAEKPIACNAPTLERIASSSEATSKVMVALPVRFARVMQRAKAAIANGAIGTPLAGRGTNHGQFPGGWFGDPQLAGGGAVMDHTVHVSDAMCWLLGKRVDDVYCQAATRMHDIPVDDVGVLTLVFESGFFASIDASWSRPESFHTWGDVWMEFVGTEGRLIIDPMTSHVRLYDDSAGKLRTFEYGDDMGRGMLESFLAFVRGDAPAGVTLEEAIHASEVVLAAYRSADSGQPAAVQSSIASSNSMLV